MLLRLGDLTFLRRAGADKSTHGTQSPCGCSLQRRRAIESLFDLGRSLIIYRGESVIIHYHVLRRVPRCPGGQCNPPFLWPPPVGGLSRASSDL